MAERTEKEMNETSRSPLWRTIQPFARHDWKQCKTSERMIRSQGQESKPGPYENEAPTIQMQDRLISFKSKYSSLCLVTKHVIPLPDPERITVYLKKKPPFHKTDFFLLTWACDYYYINTTHRRVDNHLDKSETLADCLAKCQTAGNCTSSYLVVFLRPTTAIVVAKSWAKTD
jgi:hypothetical protein